MLEPWTRTGVALRRFLGKPTFTDPVRREWCRFATQHADVVFVQIGSHDGSTDDPLRAWIDQYPAWTGVFVEPMPELFRVLSTKRDDARRFRLVRAAISDRSGTIDMVTVDATSEMPNWANQLSSIDPQVVLKHDELVPGLRSAIRAVTVPAMTFAELVDGMERIDVLHLDTEGHDAVILDQVEFDRWELPAVLFEHKHLAVPDLDRCRARLRAAGYKLWKNESDMLALRS